MTQCQSLGDDWLLSQDLKSAQVHVAANQQPHSHVLHNVFLQDPTNLQGKIQKHQAFEAELNANQSRLDAVDNTGEQLIGDEHYASDQIRERLDELHKLWSYLFERSNDKG